MTDVGGPHRHRSVMIGVECGVRTGWLLVLVATTACDRSKPPTPCPTGKQIYRGSGETHWAYDVAALRCKVDHWSGAVIDCLLRATDNTQEDRCYDQLTPAQQSSLEKALSDVNAAGTKRANADWLAMMDELHALPAFHDVPACEEYRKAMASIFASAESCLDTTEFRLMAAQTAYERSVRELVVLPAERAAEVPALCEAKARELRADVALQCPR
jgi:hypothetical protein